MELADEYNVPEILNSCLLFMKAQIDSKDILDQETVDLFRLKIFQTCFSRKKFFPFFEHLIPALAGTTLDSDKEFFGRNASASFACIVPVKGKCVQ